MKRKIRNIEFGDYEEYTHLVGTNVSLQNFIEFVYDLNDKHQILVAICDEKIVGSGTILIENKLTHNGCKLAHIENILISPNYRNNGIAKEIVEELVNIADIQKCYRIDLICKEDLHGFYSKFDFNTKQVCMTRINKNNFK